MANLNFASCAENTRGFGGLNSCRVAGVRLPRVFATHCWKSAGGSRSTGAFGSDLYVGRHYDVRAPAAARLFKEGWAPLIVFAKEPDSDRPGVANFSNTTASILKADGV